MVINRSAWYRSSAMGDRSDEVTLLLKRLEQGEAQAAEELLPLVYNELRSRAGRLMAGERADHTLQGTALVHEAFVRLVRPGANFQSRLHFFNAAALAMRRILVDHAQTRRAQKRGGGMKEVSLDNIDLAGQGPSVDMLALDEALTKLNARSPRQAQVVNLRFFAGLRDAEIGELLGITEKTVRRDWATARLWLFGEMSK
jgi:RNA polymerase sigma factor (TIGR02999 family)